MLWSMSIHVEYVMARKFFVQQSTWQGQWVGAKKVVTNCKRSLGEAGQRH